MHLVSFKIPFDCVFQVFRVNQLGVSGVGSTDWTALIKLKILVWSESFLQDIARKNCARTLWIWD